MDVLRRPGADLPVLRQVTATLGTATWFNTVLPLSLPRAHRAALLLPASSGKALSSYLAPATIGLACCSPHLVMFRDQKP